MFEFVCPICNMIVDDHTLAELAICQEALDEQLPSLEKVKDALFHKELVTEEPQRLTNGRHCYKCGTILYSGEPAYPPVPGYPIAAYALSTVLPTEEILFHVDGSE